MVAVLGAKSSDLLGTACNDREVSELFSCS